MRNIPYIDLKREHAILKDEILQAIGNVLAHSNYILGEEVAQFEREIAQYCQTRYAVGVNSGTDALFLSLKAYGIGPGDEVITAPNSFLSSASVIVAAGARPVFVDVGEDMNIDPGLIEARISKKTKAIIPVHLTGQPADMAAIIEIAQRYKLIVIEDAAQAIGAKFNGKKVGNLGNVGCFSLHPVKTLSACGDGGVITTNDKEIYQKLIQLRNIGLKNRDESETWGYNSRLDTIQAAILMVKIRYLDQWITKRRENAAYYISRLEAITQVPKEHKGQKSTYNRFVIRTNKRDELYNYLKQQGIETMIHYPIPIHLQKSCQSLGYKRGDFPVCEKQAGMILSLPVYQGLTEEELAYVADKIQSFFKET